MNKAGKQPDQGLFAKETATGVGFYRHCRDAASGPIALWKYKGVYRQADQRVGQWNDVVSICIQAE